MKEFFPLLFLMACHASPPKTDPALQEQAARITIIRDNWGIPHVYGKTDADAVFGAMYAQCEENFERVERTYIERLGRLSELEGRDYLMQDLKMRLLYDTAQAMADYRRSPGWLKNLLHAFSNGIRYYLQTHPQVQPKLLSAFEPWFPLLSTDGAFVSVQGGGLLPQDMEALYGAALGTAGRGARPSMETTLPTGSNGFALAPPKTKGGKALLYINPHVSFYFRTEMHLVSEEGLNAYGAVGWGQFFVFQGFNEHCGWMHTSTAVDAADLYAETVAEKEGRLWYAYANTQRPVHEKKITLWYKNGGGQTKIDLRTYATHHGPVVGLRSGQWLSLRAVNHSLEGLVQSWQRTKANSLTGFVKALALRGNATTNTLYADGEGNIAYWHGNRVPRRAAGLNTFAPLDGSDATTEWQGLHALNDLVHYLNPASHFLQNCNSSPLTAAGMPNPTAPFAPYLAPEEENFRSLHALQQLQATNKWSPDDLIALGYDRYLSIFDTLLPPLLQALNQNADTELQKAASLLRNWDRRSGTASVATTLAIFWAASFLAQAPAEAPADDVGKTTWMLQHTTAQQKRDLFLAVLSSLKKMYGSWQVGWGEINRYQRLAAGKPFDNQAPSQASPLASSEWGSLAAFEPVWVNGKQYGIAGNSFVALVEFGDSVKARAVVTGGQSFDPASPHFTDQAAGYLQGRFRPVWFYRKDVEAHAERKYGLGVAGGRQ